MTSGSLLLMLPVSCLVKFSKQSMKPQATSALDSSWMSLGCELLNHVTLQPGWEEQLILSRQMNESVSPDSGVLPSSSPGRAHPVPSHQSS